MPDWMEQAACRGMTDTFFSDYVDEQRMAKTFCGVCPVRAECAEAGRYEKYGVWGGLSPLERGVHSRSGGKPVGPKPCKAGCGRSAPAGRQKLCDRCESALSGLTIPNIGA